MNDTPEKRLLEAIFPDPDKNPVPRFNELVFAAAEAQEGFDNWDDGKTYYPSSVLGRGPRECTLDEVVAEWARANIELVQFVFKYGAKIIKLEGESLLGEPEGSA